MLRGDACDFYFASPDLLFFPPVMIATTLRGQCLISNNVWSEYAASTNGP